jgi:hypothetical protein
MNSFWVLVKYKDEPGAGFGRVVIQADNPFQAIQMAKAYGGEPPVKKDKKKKTLISLQVELNELTEALDLTQDANERK